MYVNIVFRPNQCKAVYIFLAALILSGCISRIPVSERVIIERAPELGGTANDILNATSYHDPDKGLKLKPGDVIYLTRWYPGTKDPAAATQRVYHWIGPQSYAVRIPIRYAKGPKAALYSYEQEFLGAVLSVNRSEKFRTVTDDQAAILKSKEIELWNSLVDSIKVKRIPYKFDNKPCKDNCNLVLTISRRVFLAPLNTSLGVKELFRPETTQAGETEFELMALDTDYGSVTDALTGKGNSTENEFYYSTGHPGYRSRFHFVTVELNGVNVNRLQWPEREWTLRVWEHSGICRAIDASQNEVDTLIQKFKLIGSGVTLRISRHPSHRPSYDVRVVVSEIQRIREVIPNKYWNPFQQDMLDEAALDMLYMEDVSRVIWQGTNPTHKKAEVLNKRNCSFR